jgi:hypothetical protein
LIVPGIILGLMFMFYGYVMIEKKRGPIQAFKESKRFTDGAKWDLFLFSLLVIGLNLLGFWRCLWAFGHHDRHVYCHGPPLSSAHPRSGVDSHGMRDLASSVKKFPRPAGSRGGRPDGGPLYPRAVSRLSPEAPVPVVDVHHEEFMPGGAGQRGANIAALGGDPILVSLVGDDSDGDRLLSSLRDRGVDVSGNREGRIPPHHPKNPSLGRSSAGGSL